MNPAAPDLYSVDDTASHNNVWRMREDLWEYLTYTAENMGNDLSEEAGDRATTDILHVLDRLKSVEGWANPRLTAIEEPSLPAEECDYSWLGEAGQNQTKAATPGTGASPQRVYAARCG